MSYCRWQWSNWTALGQLGADEGYPPIDIKFSDRLAYYQAFDNFHAKGSLSTMEDLFARYLNERLDMYLSILSLDDVE